MVNQLTLIFPLSFTVSKDIWGNCRMITISLSSHLLSILYSIFYHLLLVVVLPTICYNINHYPNQISNESSLHVLVDVFAYYLVPMWVCLAVLGVSVCVFVFYLKLFRDKIKMDRGRKLKIFFLHHRITDRM